jgi:outer membrane protein TolC
MIAPCCAAAEAAGADAATVTEVATAAGENEIRYPQLAGMADETVQQSINDAIVEKAKIAQRMVTLSTLQSGGTGLTVSYEAYLGGGVFSTVISAKGILENGRAGQSYTALTFILSDGGRRHSPTCSPTRTPQRSTWKRS